MAGFVNKCILVGLVGREPEVRTFPSGGRVAALSLATSESWKDKTSGERKEVTQWHRVSVFNEPLVKLIESYVRKGAKLYLEGQLETRKYIDKDGVEKFSTEVVLRPYRGEIVLLDGPKKDQNTPEPAKPLACEPGTYEMNQDAIPF